MKGGKGKRDGRETMMEERGQGGIHRQSHGLKKQEYGFGPSREWQCTESFRDRSVVPGSRLSARVNRDTASQGQAAQESMPG